MHRFRLGVAHWSSLPAPRLIERRTPRKRYPACSLRERRWADLWCCPCHSRVRQRHGRPSPVWSCRSHRITGR